MSDERPAADDAPVPIHWMAAISRHPELKQHVDHVLEEVGVERALLEAPDATVPSTAECLFIEMLAARVGDDVLGVKLGLQMDPHRTTLLGYLFVTADTVGDAIRAVARYLSVVRPAASAELVETANGVALSLDHRDATVLRSRQHAEFVVGALTAACRICAARPLSPASVLFAHRRDHGVETLESIIGAKVAFGHERITLELDHSALATPIPEADHTLNQLLVDHAERLLGERAQQRDGMAHRVEREVLDGLMHGAPSADSVATALGVSLRTLTRRLAEEGATFRGVVDDLRRRLAQRYLNDSAIPLVEVAFLLGYADQSAFSTAFRRWTGVSPGAWRRRNLG